MRSKASGLIRMLMGIFDGGLLNVMAIVYTRVHTHVKQSTIISKQNGRFSRLDMPKNPIF